jgi:hypothetical protein
MKKLIVAVVVALALVAFLPRPAAAGIWENGNWSNGIWQNGIWSNGIWENGVWGNGLWSNGIWENGTLLNASRLPVSELHEIAPRCSEATVDLSAVPLATVTVRLPQPAR